MGQQNKVSVPGDTWDALPDAPNAPRGASAGSSGPGGIRGAMNTAEDFGIGAVKGAGQTVFDLGNLVHSIPGVGNITDALAKLLGPEGTNPSQAFAQNPTDLASTNPTQHAGKTAEQIGEFFIPGGGAADAAEKAAVKFLPEAATKAFVSMGKGVTKVPSTAAKVTSGLGRLAARSAGEAGGAAAVAGLHGDPNVDQEAALAGSGPVLSTALSAAMRNPGVEKALAILLAGMPSGLVPGGLAGRMGTFGLIRKAVEDMLQSGPVQAIPRRVPLAMRGAAGVSSTNDTER